MKTLKKYWIVAVVFALLLAALPFRAQIVVETASVEAASMLDENLPECAPGQEGCQLKHKTNPGQGCREHLFPPNAQANGWEDGPCNSATATQQPPVIVPTATATTKPVDPVIPTATPKDDDPTDPTSTPTSQPVDPEIPTATPNDDDPADPTSTPTLGTLPQDPEDGEPEALKVQEEEVCPVNDDCECRQAAALETQTSFMATQTSLLATQVALQMNESATCPANNNTSSNEVRPLIDIAKVQSMLTSPELLTKIAEIESTLIRNLGWVLFALLVLILVGFGIASLFRRPAKVYNR